MVVVVVVVVVEVVVVVVVVAIAAVVALAVVVLAIAAIVVEVVALAVAVAVIVAVVVIVATSECEFLILTAPKNRDPYGNRFINSNTRPTAMKKKESPPTTTKKKKKKLPVTSNAHKSTKVTYECLAVLALVRCLRYTKFCWVGKHINIILKPSGSTTPGQTQPNKKVG